MMDLVASLASTLSRYHEWGLVALFAVMYLYKDWQLSRLARESIKSGAEFARATDVSAEKMTSVLGTLSNNLKDMEGRVEKTNGVLSEMQSLKRVTYCVLDKQRAEAEDDD